MGLGDDLETDEGSLRYISQTGGFAFGVSNPPLETHATLKDTEAAIALLRAVFHWRIAEPSPNPAKPPKPSARQPRKTPRL